jgi:hypothetical protein
LTDFAAGRRQVEKACQIGNEGETAEIKITLEYLIAKVRDFNG